MEDSGGSRNQLLIADFDLKTRLRRAFPRDFVRDGAIVFGSSMLLNLLGYVIHFVLSRKLGIVEYGAFASLIAATAILGIPAAIVSMVVVKFVAEFHALEEPEKIRAISLRLLGACAVLGVVALSAGIIFRSQLAGYLHLPQSSDVVAAVTALCVGMLLPPVRGVLQGTQDFGAFALSIAIDATARVILAVGLVYAGFGVSGAFVGYALAGTLSFMYSTFRTKRYWRRTPGRVIIDARRLLVTIGGAAVATATITFMGYADVALVKHLFTAADAGVYGAASFCGKILFFVVGFVPLLILPKAASGAAAQKTSSLILFQGLGATVLFAGGGLALFFLIPKTVVSITYGSAFIAAAPYIFRYGLAMSLLGATGVVATYAIGLHRFAFVVPLLALAACEPLAIVLFHRTLSDVVNILLAINFAAFVLCAAGLAMGPKSASAVAADSEMARGYTASA